MTTKTPAETARNSLLIEAKAAYKAALEENLISAYAAYKAGNTPGWHEGWWRTLPPATAGLLGD